MIITPPKFGVCAGRKVSGKTLENLPYFYIPSTSKLNQNQESSIIYVYKYVGIQYALKNLIKKEIKRHYCLIK